MKQELTLQEAYTRLTTYCARSEHSPEDIRRKLHSWGIPMEEAPAIIERLEREGFLSSERFARAFVRDKYRFNGWGMIRIRAELKRHRIPSELIDQAIDELTEEAGDEAEERLHALLASKLRSLPKSLERRKVWERLLRFGAYRGFAYEEIQTVIQELLGSSYDEDEP